MLFEIKNKEAMVTMVPSNFGYSIREAGTHFRRNWSTCLGAVVTIFLSLFVIGLFVFGSVVLQNIFGSVEDKVTIQAFLSDDAAPEGVEGIPEKVEPFMNQVKSWPNVKSVTFKSKEKAFEEYKETMTNKDATDAVAALDGKNPVPASLVIELEEPQQVKQTADRIIASPDFKEIADLAGEEDKVESSVLYGQGDVEKLFKVTSYVRIIGVALVVMLTFIAFVFINNTIRLAINARSNEIAIERLVGASNSFIRGPFLAEGALEAVLGALLAVVALQLVNIYGIPVLEQSLPFLSFSLSHDVIMKTYAGLTGIGLLIGLFGSAIAMRRYLKV